MVCGQVLGLLLAAQTLGPSWGQSVPTSPCPGIFQYEMDSSGNWHGLISVPAPQPGYTFKINVELALDAVLTTQYVGALKLMENENEVWRRINIRDRRPIRFYLYFPLSWPLPKVRSITSNENVICIDNTSNNVLTKLFLQHILSPVRGNTFQQQNYGSNYPFSGVNNFQYTTKNYPFYGVEVPSEVLQPQHHENISPQVTSWPLQTNTTAFSPYMTRCPNVFQYQHSSSGEWYGVISIPNPYPILAIEMKVEMYITGTVSLINKGLLSLVNNVNKEWKRIQTGERYFILYKLDFPLYKSDSSLTPPMPLVKDIIVNNEVICRGSKPSFPVLITLSYQHSIFSDRCSSSSLDCPYNIEKTVQRNKPARPAYEPTPSAYEPTRPVYKPTTPVYEPTPSVYEPTPHAYKPTPSAYQPTPPVYEPIPHAYEPTPPVYEPISHTYKPTPPVYEPTRPVYKSTTPVYEPISHTYKPTTPVYEPISHTYKPTTPVYKPAPPIYRPAPTVYKPVATEQPLLPPMYRPEPTKHETEKGTQCGTLIVRSNPLITHGEDTFHGQWPWHAALYLYERRDIKYRCGGSFIGTRTVITAAHCVTKNEKPLHPGDIIIYLGRYNLRNLNEDGSQNKDVTKILVHPSYNSTSTMGDIAVLILSATVEITAIVRPVCLWQQEEINPADIVDKEGLVVGWGLNEYDEPAEILKMVKMPVVSQQTCLWSEPNYYSLFTSNMTFCAGFRNGSSVCNGDSGGGMVFPKQQNSGTPIWMLRGIVSHSRPRDGHANICDTKNYIVFTDVAQYLDWIYAIII